jgi:hypothetical protein
VNRYTLDAGALIAIERRDRGLLKVLLAPRLEIAVPAGVLGQVWRDGRRQALLSAFLARPEVSIVPLDAALARAAGALCGLRRTSDVIDASVVLCARARGHHAITSDPDDLERLDPTLPLLVV